MKKKLIALICAIYSFGYFGAVNGATIVDGDLIKTADSFDIFIVKIKDSKKFKRLILNPEIFNSYGHLAWENVKTIARAELDQYKPSEFVIEVNPDGTVRDPKVYKVSSVADSDTGERRWLNITAAEFEALDYDWDSIYFINSTEASPDFYPTKNPILYAELLAKQPIKTAEPTVDLNSPVISDIKASKILADSAMISWTTDETADTMLKYGVSESALDFSATGTAAQTSVSAFSHTLSLAGLESSTKYYYQAISKDPNGNISQITTSSFLTTDCYGDVPAVQSTIQAAIDSIGKSGGKICVAAGTFNGNIAVNGKDVKIRGQGAGKTIISLSNTLTIKNVGAATELNELTIKNSTSSYAILIEDSSPVIKNNHIIDSFAGIKISGNSRPTIKYNVFSNNSGGIALEHAGNSGDYDIDHNTFVANGNAVAIQLSSAFTSSPINIKNNIFSKNFTGVYETVPSNFYLWNNLFYNNSEVNLRRQNSYYYGATAINDLTIATKNVIGDPLLDSTYKPKTNSPAIGAGTESTNIGAY